MAVVNVAYKRIRAIWEASKSWPTLDKALLYFAFALLLIVVAGVVLQLLSLLAQLVVQYSLLLFMIGFFVFALWGASNRRGMRIPIVPPYMRRRLGHRRKRR